MRIGTMRGVVEIAFLKYNKKQSMVEIAADRILTGYSKFHMDESEFRKLAIKMTIKGYAFIDKTESFDRNEDEIEWYKVTDFENWER